jgi:hypothetical protein
MHFHSSKVSISLRRFLQLYEIAPTVAEVDLLPVGKEYFEEILRDICVDWN